MKKSIVIHAFICMLIYFGGFITKINAQGAGDIIITEFMANPSMVADVSGEWIEIYNVTDFPINLQGLRLKDNGTDDHILDFGGGYILTPGSYLVLGNSYIDNGGVMVDYKYSNFSLTNTTGDAIILTDNSGTTVIDEVSYTTCSSGKSWNLDPLHFSSTDNNDPGNWCLGTEVYGDGDYGTPHFSNTSCNLTEIESSYSFDNDFKIILYKNTLKVYIPDLHESTMWMIVDMLGKTVCSGNNAGHTEYAIDISALSKGTYLFGFLNYKGYKKFIVK